jgi:hypothetical protein
VDGLRDIMLAGQNLLDVGFQLSVLIGFAVVISVVTTVTLRRSSAS